MTEHQDVQLSRFQLDLAALFFSLPESTGFLLAGGGALIAQGLVNRGTDDLDFFVDRARGDVATAAEALTVAADDHDWRVDVVRTGHAFRRLEVTRATMGADEHETVLVDLAVDSPPVDGPTVTIAGPALGPRELAIRKTLTLYSRAEPRDFTDVHALHQRFDRGEIVEAAAQADRGFDRAAFVQMLRSHRRLRDDDFPTSTLPVEALRQYFDDWAREISS